MVLNLRHAVLGLAAALPLTLAGCSDSAPGKSEVKTAMEATLNQQIEQLKGLARQLGNSDKTDELDNLQFQVDVDKVSDCEKNENDTADKDDQNDGDDASQDSPQNRERWTCHVTGKITVDKETQAVDDDVTLIKADDGSWLAR